MSGKVLDQLYLACMPRTPEERTEAARAEVYSMIKGYDDFMNLEAAINAYGEAMQRRGFREGFLAGFELYTEVLTRHRSEAIQEEGKNLHIQN